MGQINYIKSSCAVQDGQKPLIEQNDFAKLNKQIDCCPGPLVDDAIGTRQTQRDVEMAFLKVKEIVASNPIVVFSKTYCPFCVDVKKLLTQLGASFKPIELDTESDGKEIQDALAEWTGQWTVPNVFISGNHIGGCDKTTALHQEGKLVLLLDEAGALSKAS